MREYDIAEPASRRSHPPVAAEGRAERRAFGLRSETVRGLDRAAIDALGAGLDVSLLNRTSRSQSRAGRSLLRLQRHYGNRYVQRVLALARQGEGEPEVAPEVEYAIERARGGGHTLGSGVRLQMESVFGSDFSGVRIHTDPEAHSLNEAVSAIAFTTGQDIFFRGGAYNPSNSEGKELLAHELAHVVQQGGASVVSGKAQRVKVQRMCPACNEEKKEERLQHKLAVGQSGDRYEQEADQVARSVVRTLDAVNAATGPAADAMLGGASFGITGAPRVIHRQGISPPTPQPTGAQPAPVNAQPVPAECQKPPLPLECTAATRGSKAGTTESLPGGCIRLIAKARRLDANFADAGPEVEINTPNQQVDLGKVTNEDRGFIRFVINADWDFENPGLGLEPANGCAKLVTTTPFRIPKELKEDEDKVKFSKTRPTVQFSAGSGASLDKQPSTSEDPDDLGGSVTVAPSITYQVQTARQVQGGFNVTVLVLSEGVQVADQVAVNEVESVSKAYTAKLTYQAPPPPPPPPSPKPYDCKRAGDPANADGGFGPFVIASDRFMQEDDARQKIHDWYFDLEAPVRQDLEQGKGILRVTGRASPTGSQTFNLELAERRAKKVRDIIADFAGSNAHLNSFALGRFGAQTPPGKEVASERRVDVEVSGQVPGDQVKDLKGDGCSGGKGGATPTGPTGPVNPPSPDVTPAGGAGAGPSAPEAGGGGATSPAAAPAAAAAASAPGGSEDFEEAQSNVGGTSAPQAQTGPQIGASEEGQLVGVGSGGGLESDRTEEEES